MKDGPSGVSSRARRSLGLKLFCIVFTILTMMNYLY